MSYRRRVDANHGQISSALRRLGWYVLDCSRVGGGFPDLIAAKRGRIRFIEVKDGSLPPSGRKLTVAETKLHADFQAAGVDVEIVTSVEDVLPPTYDEIQASAKPVLCAACAGVAVYRTR